jgi:hypothetical protein
LKKQTLEKFFSVQSLLGFPQPFIIPTMFNTHPSSPLRCVIGLTSQVVTTVFYWELVSGNALSWTEGKDMALANILNKLNKYLTD